MITFKAEVVGSEAFTTGAPYRMHGGCVLRSLMSTASAVDARRTAHRTTSTDRRLRGCGFHVFLAPYQGKMFHAV